MNTFIKTINGADRVLTLILKIVTVTIFIALMLIITANILLRIFPITSLHWADEIQEMLIAALVFYGAAGVWMVKGHFSVGDWISTIVKNQRARSAYRLLVELISLAFAFVLFYYSLILVLKTREVSAVFQIPKRIFYSPIPAAGAIMTVYSLVYVARTAIGIFNPKSPLAMTTEKEAAPAEAPSK